MNLMIELFVTFYGIISLAILVMSLLPGDAPPPPGLWWSWPIVCLALAVRWLTCQILNGLWLIWCCVVDKATCSWNRDGQGGQGGRGTRS